MNACFRSARRGWLFAALALLVSLAPVGGTARAGTVLVAVAANFAEAAQRLKPVFRRETGDDIVITVGSTGKLYAQIVNGAPYDILLAADQRRARLLEEGGQAVAGTRFTYATGQLSLWSPDPGAIAPGQGPALLAQGGFRHLAIANPALAPYGAAARQTLERLGLWRRVQPRLVMGQNVGQVFSMVATGNAELGIIARSYALSPRNITPGSRWDIPADMHAPIRQDAVLLKRAADNAAARAFLAFLSDDPAARAVIRGLGYGVGG